MICKACATESDGDFCPNCGTPFEKEESINNYCQQPQPVQQYSYQTPPPKKKGNGLMIALIAIGAVLVIGIFAVVGLLAKDGTSNPDSPPTDTTATGEDYVHTTEPDNGKVDYEGNQIVMPEPEDNIIEPDFLYNERTLYIEPSEGLVLRTGPGKGYEKIFTIEYAKDVIVMGGSTSAKNWVYIYYAGSYGWVCSDYLSETMPKKDYHSNNNGINYSYSPNEYYEYYEYVYAYVTPSKGLNIREGASTSSRSLVVLPKNTQVTVMGYSPYDTDWYYVYCYYKGGYYYGFVNGDYLDM